MKKRCDGMARLVDRYGSDSFHNDSLREPASGLACAFVITATPERTTDSETPAAGVRAARVEAILRATLEHLAFVGYRALRIEDIAVKAGVAKTTIYRRWPTKKELVRDALESATGGMKVADTGSLRGDLLALGREFLALASSARGQSLFRICVVECADPELEAIADGVRCQHEDAIDDILHRAIARGEVAADTDPKLFLAAFAGPLHLKLFFNNERVDEVFMSRLIDLLIHGAAGRGDARPSPGRGTTRRRPRR